MARSEMIFIFGTDENFVMPCGIAMRSLDRFLGGEDRILLLHLGLSAGALSLIAESIQNASLTCVDCSGKIPSSWYVPRYFTSAVYLRLLAPELLPDDHRCVYLDGDILVRHDPRPLHDIDLRGRTLGAVRSRTTPFLASPDGIAQWLELGLQSTAPYFNSGVLAIDLERWRRLDVTARAADFLERFGESTTMADQDALNVAVSNDWLPLDRGWNYITHVTNYFLQQPEIEPHDPSIVHFAGDAKPWLPGIQPLHAEEWFKLLDGSPWSGFRPPEPSSGIRLAMRRRVSRSLRKVRNLVNEA